MESVVIKYKWNIATITPARGGERPQFMDFCKLQVERMRPVHQIYIDHKPISSAIDLVPRIRLGIETARSLGCDRVAIVENDDWYDHDYLSQINLDDYDAFGWGTTYYYNLRNRTWQLNYHQDTHSSLFSTAFKIGLLDDFRWPPDDNPWLDIALWKHFRGKRAFLSQADPPCIGIKHGIGKVGGKAHGFEMKNKDPQLEWLKSNVDDQAFKFYSEMKF